MSKWYRSGKPVDSVAIDDRAVQYGDGLFETIAIRDGLPRLFGRHMLRLVGGCTRLGIEPPDPDQLEQDLLSALENNQAIAGHCIAKILVSSGTGERGYGRASPTASSVLVGIFPGRPVAADRYAHGVDAVLCETRLAGPSATAGLKTLNRIEQVLGRSECLAAAAFEGLMLDADGRLICGTMSNVFVVNRQKISTPSLQRCGVEGVMRSFIIDTLRDNGVAVGVSDITFGGFLECDEAFLANSQFGVLPLRRCEDRELGIGPVSREVMATLARNGIAECAA